MEYTGVAQSIDWIHGIVHPTTTISPTTSTATTTTEPTTTEMSYGNKVQNASEYPFMASIQYRDIHYCGGSIIALDKILTSARCIDPILKKPLGIEKIFWNTIYILTSQKA